MADNTQLNIGAAGDLIRSVDKLGKKTQVVTLDLGGAGAEALTAGTVPVSGTVGVNNFPATQAVSGTVALDAASLAALETISVANFPANVALTNTELRATAVPVSGAFFQATQPVSLTSTTITGTVAATKSGAYPLDTALKGTTAAGNVTSEATDANTQSLHARITNPSLAVTGAFFQATQPISAASLPLPTGAGTETTLAGVRTDLGTDGTTPPAVLGAGTGVRGWLRSIYEKLTGSIAVTGTFFQATQPVSIAASVAVTGPLTDTQIRATALPVSGAFFQATQPVSALGLTDHTQTFKPVITATTISLANTAITLTLPAVAAQFHYITRIVIKTINPTATALGGGAVTLAFTTTNLPTGLAWTDGNALGAGLSKSVTDEVLRNPIKSTTVNTATTIVAPACGAGILSRLTVYYYTGA